MYKNPYGEDNAETWCKLQAVYTEKTKPFNWHNGHVDK
jgi:hypothetical protein